MSRDAIIKMAQEAGLIIRAAPPTKTTADCLEAFAALVAAAERERIMSLTGSEFAVGAVRIEREACANVAKAISDKYAFGYYGQEVDTADEIEAAIRARGTP